jgi:hypothetical protein
MPSFRIMAFKVVMYSHTFLLGAAGEQEENALERPLVDLRRRWVREFEFSYPRPEGRTDNGDSE